MKNLKLWPHVAIIGIVIAIAAGLGVAWWMKNETTAQAEELPYAARIQRVDGEVAFNDSVAGAEGDAWTTAALNQPYSVGDRIYTRDGSRASVAFTGRNFAVLDPNTSLDLVGYDDERTQLALRDGSATFDLGYLRPDEVYEVGTPYGAVDFMQPGLYNVGFDDNGNVLVSVLSGLAQVVGLAGSGQINKGEMLTLLGTTAAQVALSKLNGDDAGYLVNDYYGYQYPNYYDGRYSNYDAYLNDPYYYDPYRRNQSYQYVSSIIPGVNDLDYYGDWQNIDGYGYAWRPRVDSGWVPYQQGYWVNDYPYGPTWVSSEPWGYAPYHYGRWANVGNQWYWVPEGTNTTPLYSPALVAFVPLDSNQIGWVPLAPGEAYAPRYYDENWQPHYLSRSDLSPAQLANMGIPGAVTVVPVDAFGRPIDRNMIRRLDQGALARVQPTLDPLALTPLRNAALHSAWGRGKIDLPPGIAKKLDDTPVFVGQRPRGLRSRKDLAKSLRVETVPDKVKREKIKFDDRRGQDTAMRTPRGGRPDDVARKQEIHRLNQEAAKGNRDAARQSQQLQQQQRRVEVQQKQVQKQQEREARRAVQQPQGERVANPAPRGRQDVPRAREPQRNTEPPRVRQNQARQDVPVQAPRGQVQKQQKQQQSAPAPSGGGGHGGGGGKGKKGKG